MLYLDQFVEKTSYLNLDPREKKLAILVRFPPGI